MGIFARFVKSGKVGPTITAPPPMVAPPKRPAALRDSEDDEGSGILYPIASNFEGHASSRRRAALDMVPKEAWRCAPTDEQEGFHPRCSTDSCSSSSSTDIESSYTDLVLIHRGRHGMVYRARERRTRNRVVLKLYASAQQNATRSAALERELRLHDLVGSHAGVVNMPRVISNPDGTYLVLQACNGGTLIEAVANAGGKLPERQTAVKVAVPLLQALQHLHSSGVMHRHIRPEHLLINQGVLKVTDLGSGACFDPAAAQAAQRAASAAKAAAAINKSGAAQHLQQQRQQQGMGSALSSALVYAAASDSLSGGDAAMDVASGDSFVGSAASEEGRGDQQEQVAESSPVQDARNYRMGSIEYMAPEMLSKPTQAEVFHLVLSQGIDEEELPVYDEKVDIWSVGAVVFEAVTGYQPFLADSAADMAAVIASRLGTKAEDGTPDFLCRHGLSPELQDFLKVCFNPNPEERPSAKALLQHAWLAEAAAAAAQQQAEAASGAAAAASAMVRRSLSLSAVNREVPSAACVRSRTSRLMGGSSVSTGSVLQEVMAAEESKAW